MSNTVEVTNENTEAEVSTFCDVPFYKLGNDTPSGAPVVNGDFEQLRFEANRAISDAELEQLMQILGFAWKVTVRGDRLTRFKRNGPNAVVVYVALASSNSSNRWDRFEEFLDSVNDYIADGSTVKKDGTQLVSGIDDLSVTVWADEVFQDLPNESYNKMQRLANRPSPFAPANLSGKTRDEIVRKLSALVSIKDSMTTGEQDILAMAHDLMVITVEAEKRARDAEAKLEAVKAALSA